MSALVDLLTETAPPWASITSTDGTKLRVAAAPPKLSGAPGDRFELFIETFAFEATVSEVDRGTRLPLACPERHINGDGSFCLGFRQAAITSRDNAQAFWSTLRGYLLAQQFAERHGRWPPGRWLSHGSEAAASQIAAERSAVICGLNSEYAAALNYGIGWLAGILPEVFEAECCDHALPARPSRSNKLGLVKGCASCDALAELLQHEQARRSADAFFVQMARSERPCCETMPRCPLRADSANL